MLFKVCLVVVCRWLLTLLVVCWLVFVVCWVVCVVCLWFVARCVLFVDFWLLVGVWRLVLDVLAFAVYWLFVVCCLLRVGSSLLLVVCCFFSDVFCSSLLDVGCWLLVATC